MYSKLPPGHIRILTMPLSDKDAPIECKLETLELGSEPAFEALSYEWNPVAECGAPHDLQQEIQVDGKPFLVGKNLWVALQALKDPDLYKRIQKSSRERVEIITALTKSEDKELMKSFMDKALKRFDLWPVTRGDLLLSRALSVKERTESNKQAQDIAAHGIRVWVDAICINQNDIVERNQQVQIMGDIYRAASRVRVWLGHGTDSIVSSSDPGTVNVTEMESNRAFTLLDNFHDALMHNYHIGDEFGQRVNRLLHAEPSLIGGIAFVAEKSYWTRVWIVQEFVLARKVTLHYGDSFIDSDVFYLLTVALTNHFELDDTCDPYVKDIVHMIKRSQAQSTLILRAGYHNGSEMMRLATLLYQCQRSHCTVPHDRVYALLGLANDMTKDSIIVNYEIPISQLRRDVIEAYSGSWIASFADRQLEETFAGYTKQKEVRN